MPRKNPNTAPTPVVASPTATPHSTTTITSPRTDIESLPRQGRSASSSHPPCFARSSLPTRGRGTPLLHLPMLPRIVPALGHVHESVELAAVHHIEAEPPE